jgi:predicted nucleotidyltransferase
MNWAKKKDILHYPQLDTVLMVEEFIRKHSGEYRRKVLWQKLPRRMMYQTFQVILSYLIDSGKIVLDREEKIVWIWKPELTKKYAKKKHLFLKPEKIEGDEMKEINEIKQKAIPVLKRNGVVKAGIFGSYATGKAVKSSDIDMLVKFSGKKSLLDLAGLKIELESKLGKKVDILTYNSVHPLLKDKIFTEVQRILGQTTPEISYFSG